MFHLFTVEEETYRLLKKIFSMPEIGERFALAGGTALALQIGHRTSVDLDIFSTADFDTKELELLLSSEDGLNVELVGSNRKMLFTYINNIKCDFVTEPARKINMFETYDDVQYFSVADIAAMKMHTVCGRGKKKDFFDIYALTKIYGWKKMLEWFEQKYSSDQLYFLWRSIFYFDDAENDPDIKGFAPFDKNWSEIKTFISDQCI